VVPHTNLLVALGEVRQVLADPERGERDFYPAAHRFLQCLHAQLAGRGMAGVGLDTWDPRPALLLLEASLVADPQLDPALAATAKTIRDSLDAAGRAMAALN